MKKIIVLLLFASAVLLSAAESLSVLEWDFTKGSLTDLSGKCTMFLRGKTVLCPDGVKVGVSPVSQREGAATRTVVPELSPKAFRLTIEWKAGDFPGIKESPYLFDNQYSTSDDGIKYGLKLYLDGAGKSYVRPVLCLGSGTAGEMIRGERILWKRGEITQLQVVYDGIKNVRFFVNGKKNREQQLTFGGPLAPARHVTVFGDRVMSNHHHFPGIIRRVKMEAFSIPPAALQFPSRRAFRRGEEKAFAELELQNFGTWKDVSVRIRGKDGIIGKDFPVRFNRYGDTFRTKLPVRTNLQPGDYPCTLVMKGKAGEKPLEFRQDFNLMIGPRVHPGDQYRYFSLNSFPMELYDSFKSLGVNVLKASTQTHFDFKKKTFSESGRKKRIAMMDVMLRDGIIYGETAPLSNAQLRRMYPRTLKDGKPWEKNLDASHPEVVEHIRKSTEAISRQVDSHPAFGFFQAASEVRDSSRPSFAPHYREAWKKFSGKEIPKEGAERLPPIYKQLKNFPKNRILPDDWPLLVYYRWFWKTGDGWNRLEDVSVEAFKKHFRQDDLPTYYDPIVRVPPLWGNCGDKVNLISQWTYVYPEPFNIWYVISEQNAMARGPGKHEVTTDIQGISYRSKIAPKDLEKNLKKRPAWHKTRPDVVYMTTPPDVMREALWTVFSRQLRGYGTFGWRALYDALPYGYGGLANTYQITNTGTREVIKEELHKAGIPLGPLFRAVPDRAPETAVLESYASCLFARRGTWGWSGSGYDLGILFTRAKLAPAVLYEEELALRGVPSTVKILFMHHCDVLTESAFRAVRKFQARGGIVVGDANLVPGITPDFLLPAYHRTREASQDKAAMLKACKELRKMLANYFAPYADSENPDLLPFVRTNGSADCLFVVNDRRTFGDYVGMYGRLMEKGLPNKGTVTLDRKSGAVYDLVLHKPVPFENRKGKTVIPVEFSTCGGTVFLVTASPLRDLTLSVQRKGRTLDVRVTAPEKDVIRPVRLTVTSSEGLVSDDSGYSIIQNGQFRREVLLPDNGFRKGIRIEVQDLATGKNLIRSL